MVEVASNFSRDLWSHGSTQSLRDLLASSLTTLLLSQEASRPVYFCSPWISDFVLLDNRFRQYGDLFPEKDMQAQYRFSEFLVQLSALCEVRIVTVRNDVSLSFLRSTGLRSAPGVEIRFAPDEHHEKGILTSGFYIEGSMNITFSGVWIRGEKVAYHTAGSSSARERLFRAYLEFDRYWDLLSVVNDGQ